MGITTTGTITGNTVLGTTSVTGGVLTATTSLVTPSITSDTNTLMLGGDSTYTIQKPQHTSANGTDLVFKGQQAAPNSNGNGGDVALQPGSKDGSGIDGKINFKNSDGNTVMQVSGSTVEVMTGNTLSIAGSLSVEGTRVAVPSAVTVNGDSTTVNVNAEFLVLNCDDSDSNM